MTVHGLCYAHPFLLVVTELCSGGDLQSVLRHPEVGWPVLASHAYQQTYGPSILTVHLRACLLPCSCGGMVVAVRWR